MVQSLFDCDCLIDVLSLRTTNNVREIMKCMVAQGLGNSTHACTNIAGVSS